MEHTFFLLHSDEWSYDRHDLAALRSHPTRVVLADDLIWYLADTLQWVATENPASPSTWPGHGLNLYGPTVITQAGAPQWATILDTWAVLFAHGPPTLTLRGLWTLPAADEAVDTRGFYATLTVERDALIATLLALASYAQQVQTDDWFILHLGI